MIGEIHRSLRKLRTSAKPLRTRTTCLSADSFRRAARATGASPAAHTQKCARACAQQNESVPGGGSKPLSGKNCRQMLILGNHGKSLIGLRRRASSPLVRSKEKRCMNFGTNSETRFLAMFLTRRDFLC